MKRTFTFTMLLALISLGSLGLQPKEGQEAGSNFRPIDNFEEGVSLWWNPDGANQTRGVIMEDAQGNPATYRAAETEIVNPETGSTGSMKLAVVWDTDVEWFEPTIAGSQSHMIRLYMPPGNANVPSRQFGPGQAIELFIYGDASGHRFRFMVRDAASPRQLEGSQWYTIDFTGWKRFTWDYNDAANVFGWVSGDGVMDGELFYFDSFMLTRDEQGTVANGVFYIDDLRIVDPFDVDFVIADANGSEVISIDGITYPAGQTSFKFLPREYLYFVKKDGFETASGTFTVESNDIQVPVTLTAGADPVYTVTFNVSDQNEAVITDAVVAVNGQANAAGDYVFQLTSGFYTYTINKELFFETQGSFIVRGNNIFINAIITEIPDIYDNVILYWDVASTASQATSRDETYSVWVAKVSSEDQAFNASDYVKVFEETLPQNIPNWQYQPRKVNFVNFSYENIKIAFRHNGSTNKDRIVIDNVRIRAYDVVENEVDYLLNEDFEGGVPAGFDPDDSQPKPYDKNWLPEGWRVVDLDQDGNKWYFDIRILQGGYQAHMRSNSFDPAGAGTALTPDNWLITPMIAMPVIPVYDVRFVVRGIDGGALNGAVVTLNGQSNIPGNFSFERTSGSYDYTVELEGYVTVTGTLEVVREDVEVVVVLEVPPVYNVTFRVDMRQYGAFDPAVTQVYMTGTFPGWDNAIPGTFPEQQMSPTGNVFFRTRTLQLNAGTYFYKYFDGPSLDKPEWQGEPFRRVVVEANMEVNDIYGVQVSVVDPSIAESVRIYPNPASNQVKITSDYLIESIAVFNVAGQQVYQNRVENNSYTLNLESLREGIYLVRLTSNQGVVTRRVQVVR